jgi:hypothetical protein
MAPLRNELLIVVTSNNFATFKIAVTSNFSGAITVKNRQRIKSSKLLLPVMEVK